MHKRTLHEEALVGLAHDLRTPLTAIRSFSEILLDNPGLPISERNRFLGIVLAESERLHHHIEHVLDFAQDSAGRCPEAVPDAGLGESAGIVA